MKKMKRMVSPRMVNWWIGSVILGVFFMWMVILPLYYADRIVSNKFLAYEEMFMQNSSWATNHARFKTVFQELFEIPAEINKMELWASRFNKLPIRNLRNSYQQFSKAILLVVHKRATYLRETLRLWKEVAGIENVLLVVSHDGLYDEVVEAINEINFCPVKELIFPYHEGWVKTVNKPQFGYRFNSHSSRSTYYGSLKLHWVWAMSEVWDHIQEHYFINEVLYVEDDIWPSPGLLKALEKLNSVRDKYCKSACFGSEIGRHTAKTPQELGIDDAWKTFPVCELINSPAGFSIPRRSWEMLKMNGDLYCDFPSKSWDDSLYGAMGMAAIQAETPDLIAIPPLVLKATLPRALHTGLCGGIHEYLMNKAYGQFFQNSSIDMCSLEFSQLVFKYSMKAPNKADTTESLHEMTVPSQNVDSTAVECVQKRSAHSMQGFPKLQIESGGRGFSEWKNAHSSVCLRFMLNGKYTKQQ